MSTEFEQPSTPDDDFESMLEASFGYAYTPPRRGEIRNATILQVEDREIIVDLGAKQDGLVPLTDIERMDDELYNSLEVGKEVPVYVMNPSDSQGNLVVSIN
ncbi:MAG: S1 RNA-binding domain-containing protein, partial [Chloroflexota bacterium]